MRKILLLACSTLAFALTCISQSSINIVDNRNKVIKKYSENDYIIFYQNEIKSGNDTTVETSVSGGIVAISKDSITLNFVTINKDYYQDNHLVFTRTLNAEENPDFTRSFPISSISAFYSESRGKSFGNAIAALGLVGFVIAPITSMSFQDLDYFNISNYLITASLGITLGIAGLAVNKLSKDKYFRINSSIPCLEANTRGRIYEGKIQIVSSAEVR